MSRRAGAPPAEGALPPAETWSLAAVTWDPSALTAGVVGDAARAAASSLLPALPAASQSRGESPPTAPARPGGCTFGLAGDLCCVSGCEAKAEVASPYVRPRRTHTLRPLRRVWDWACPSRQTCTHEGCVEDYPCDGRGDCSFTLLPPTQERRTRCCAAHSRASTVLLRSKGNICACAGDNACDLSAPHRFWCVPPVLFTASFADTLS